MASLGVSYARIHVLQKQLKEKLKKREQEEKPARREKAHKERKPSHKVYPGAGAAADEPAGAAGVGTAAAAPPLGVSMK